MTAARTDRRNPASPTLFAFYGRVSTEDRQSPESSRLWQYDCAERLVVPKGGVIVEEFFDIGVSRRLPWTRRPQANRLLDALRDPDRGFSAVVVGEPSRALYSGHWDQIGPLFNHFGVEFWVPNLGGPVDMTDAGHDMQLSIYGSMSKMERTVMQKRVRDSMASLATKGDRFMGGRPPYGYSLADAGPHPNPSKAADGKRLHRLVADPVTGSVVALIFELFIAGESLGAIAAHLVAAGHPSPSAHDRLRNQHRLGQGWAKSAIRAILRNERYTGREVFRKQPATYELIDPNNPSYGDQKVQRWADPATWIVSEGQVHEALISRETYAAAQQRFATPVASPQRKPRVSTYDYLFKGRVTCSACERRMEGSRNNRANHYRCRVRDDYVLPLSTPHPRSTYVREDALVVGVDDWLLRAFAPENLEPTIRALLSAASAPQDTSARAALVAELKECDDLLDRYKAALAGSTEPLTTVVQWIAEAESRRTTALTALARLTPKRRPSERVLADLLRDAPAVRERLAAGSRDGKRGLYEALDLRFAYDPINRMARFTANLAGVCGNRACPRGDLNPHSP